MQIDTNNKDSFSDYTNDLIDCHFEGVIESFVNNAFLISMAFLGILPFLLICVELMK